MKKLLLTVESITYAMKTRKLLGASGIRSEVVKVDSTDTGCTHAVEIAYGDLMSATRILRDHGIYFNVKTDL